MKNIKSSLLTLLFISIPFIMLSLPPDQQGYEIKVQINGLTNSDLYLGFHHGNKQFIKDTIKLNENGEGTFKGKERLQQGIYLVITPEEKYFEILVGEDQHFSLKTRLNKFINTLEFQGSEINQAFTEYQKFMREKNQKSAALKKKLNAVKGNKDSTQLIREQMEELDKQVKSKWNSIISEHPNSLLAAIIKGMKNVEVPDFNISESAQNKDSIRLEKRYQFYRNHFFDHIDLSDSRLVRTPILHRKIDHYFNNILVQEPDSIITEVNRIVSKTKGSEETYEYVVRYLLNHYQQSNIMGMDKVFVHIAEKYYLSGRADWADSSTIKKLRDRVSKIKPNLIGKKAPKLKTITSSGEDANLHDVDSEYTLLYFWEPSCSHCKKLTPKIHDLYQNYSRDQFEVFAVYTQTDKKEWMEYLNNQEYDWIHTYDPEYTSNFRKKYDVYSTPTVYLLDEEKTIVAKRLDFESLKEMLEKKIGSP
ncbi:MAG: thioredoxin-like domain-containing protein [Bacteroidota bacterium]